MSTPVIPAPASSPAAEPTAAVAIRDLEVAFTSKAGHQVVVADFTFAVAPGEVVALIGHSGCGKTTLLNCIAGLLAPTRGAITCAGKPVRGPGPDRGMVFQSHALLPWMTCFDNVHLGVAHIFGAREPKARLVARTHAALEMVRLSEAAQKYPAEISGGMKQRVGIARALAMEPEVLLLDEPFGALDALTRAHLQDELARIIRTTRTTTIMVTHDVDEAVLLADRIVMMGLARERSLGGVVSVQLPRPRDRIALAADPVFIAARTEVLAFLHGRR